MEVCRDVLSRLVSIFGTPPFMYLLLFQNKDESFVFGNFILSFGDRLNPSWKPLMSGAVSLALSASMPSFSQSICSFISLSFFCPTGNGNHYFAIFHKRGCQNVIASCLHWIVGYPIAHHAAVFYAECIPHLPEL